MNFEQREAYLKSHTKRCWLYVICWQRRGPVKIGIARNLPERLRGLQGANPYRLGIFKGYACQSFEIAFSLERKAHKRLHGRRLRGEWFQATALEAATAIEYVLREHDAQVILWRGSRSAETIAAKKRKITEEMARATAAMREYEIQNGTITY